MTMMINTLEFAEAFEAVGFEHDKAKALATAFGKANEAGREDIVTKAYLDTRLAEIEMRIGRQIADVGLTLNGRLWSTITIIAGVSTAISATIGAGVALILKGSI